jgi:AraC-like DNA-binding protein
MWPAPPRAERDPLRPGCGYNDCDVGTSVLFVHALIEALERTGVSRERFLQAAPIDRALLERSDGRLSLASFDALLEFALELTGDPAFGLRMGDMVNPATYNLSMHLTAHASTMREGIESLGRFYRLLTDRPFWRFVEDDRTGTIVFDAGRGDSPGRRFRCELTIGNFYKMLAAFVSGSRAEVVAFDYPAPPYRVEYARIFQGAERFEQAFTGIVFGRELLDVAQIRHDPELHATIVARAEKRVSQMPGASFADRIKRHILDAKPQTRHDMPSVARALGVSARSLRRRLAEERTSFREVADAALGALAKRLVLEEERPIEDVAYTMGFSHASAFHRAFKRWTGATPAATRSARKVRNVTGRYSDSASGPKSGR